MAFQRNKTKRIKGRHQLGKLNMSKGHYEVKCALDQVKHLLQQEEAILAMAEAKCATYREDYMTQFKRTLDNTMYISDIKYFRADVDSLLQYNITKSFSEPHKTRSEVMNEIENSFQ